MVSGLLILPDPKFDTETFLLTKSRNDYTIEKNVKA